MKKIRRLGCDQVEVFFEETELRRANAGMIHPAQRESGYAVRFLKSGRLGFLANEDPETLFQSALEKVMRLEECPVAPLTFPRFHDKRQTPPHYDAGLDRQPFEERVALLQDFGALEGGRYAERVRHFHLVNTGGLDLSFKCSYFEWRHEDGRALQTRRFRDLAAAYRPPPPQSAQIKRVTLSKEFVIMAPAAAQLLATLAPRLLENATSGEWPLSNPEITLIDDGAIPHGWGTEPVDAEGSMPERTILVQDGEAVGVLADCRLAHARRARSTGNCVRENFRDEPRCGFTNLVLAPGVVSLDDYLSDPTDLSDTPTITALHGLRIEGEDVLTEARGFSTRYGENTSAIVAEFRAPIEEILGRVLACFSDTASTSRFIAPSLLVRSR